MDYLSAVGSSSGGWVASEASPLVSEISRLQWIQEKILQINRDIVSNPQSVAKQQEFLTIFLSSSSLVELENLEKVLHDRLEGPLQETLREVCKRKRHLQWLGDSYGNKSANLLILREVVAPLHFEKGGVSIPDFLPLSDQEIKAHLDEVTRGKLQELFQKCREVQGDERALKEETKELLVQIRELLRGSFSKVVDFPTVEMWLSDHKNDSLMVRSTGKEDGSQFANAGGNESLACIKPEMESVLKAIGDVIASYYSEKSIEQQLAAGKPFLEEPVLFLPVLIQKMVGEVRGESVPLSGVGFSQEPEGEAIGVCTIQVVRGHNEALVKSMMPAATYYMNGSGMIHPVIYHQPMRLAPSEDKEELALVPNEKGTEHAILPKEVLHDLYLILKAVERYYGRAMDMEFVVQGNEIFLVQARPLNIKEKLASYVKEVHKVALEAKIEGETLIVGAAKALNVTKDQVIVADNLTAALDIYQRNPEVGIKAVIVKTRGEKNSHPAICFREFGIPVIYVSDKKTIDRWMTEPETSLVIDCQTGVVINQRLSDVVIEKGWSTYPIALRFSSIDALIENELSGEDLALVAEKQPVKMGVRDLFNHLKHGSKEEAIAALSTLFRAFTYFSEKEIQRYAFIDREGFNEVKVLWKQAASVVHQIIDVILHGSEIEQRLMPVRQLEALLHQSYSANVMGSSSFGEMHQVQKQEEAILQGLDLSSISRKRIAYVVQLMKGKKEILTEDLKMRWEKFVMEVAAHQEVRFLGDLVAMVSRLKKLGVFDTWLHQVFLSATKKEEGGAISLLMALKREFDESEDVVQKAGVLKESIQRSKTTLFNWEDPKNFEALQARFLEEFAPFLTGELLTPLLLENRLNRIILLKMVSSYTDLFDQVIKTIKGASEYPQEVKGERIYVMMLTYYELMKNMALLVEHKEEQLMLMTFDGKGANWPIRTYIEKIKELLESKKGGVLDRKMMLPSVGFNVQASKIGSKTDFDRHLPDTIEDLFTLVHQNILVCISALMEELEDDRTMYPDILNLFATQIEQIRPITEGLIENSSVSLIGKNIEYPLCSLTFNMPLRQHSSTFTLEYDIRSKKCILKGSFYGHNEQGRMNALIYYLQAWSGGMRIVFDQFPEHSEQNKTLSFAWDLSSIRKENLEEVAKSMREAFYEMGKLTMGTWAGEIKDKMRSPATLMRHMHETFGFNWSDMDHFSLLRQGEWWEEYLFDRYTEIGDLATAQLILKESLRRPIVQPWAYEQLEVAPEGFKREVFEELFPLIEKNGADWFSLVSACFSVVPLGMVEEKIQSFLGKIPSYEEPLTLEQSQQIQEDFDVFHQMIVLLIKNDSFDLAMQFSLELEKRGKLLFLEEVLDMFIAKGQFLIVEELLKILEIGEKEERVMFKLPSRRTHILIYKASDIVAKTREKLIKNQMPVV